MMNATSGAIASAIGDMGSDELSFATFNQDSTSLAVGTASGYKLYTFSSTDNLEVIHENLEEVYIVERLFSSSLLAVVAKASPRKLRVCHFLKGAEICTYSHASRILAVKMNRDRLIVCMEDSLVVHNIRDMKVLHVIKDTPTNKLGVCALSIDSKMCYLAYPGHATVGELQIFDALNLSSIAMIPAHSGQLAAIQFSPCGTKVATASDKGTVIRVFNVANGTRLHELRRGLKRTAEIHSLAFSPCGDYLASSSNTETVHIFRLNEKPKESESSNRSPQQSKSSNSWMQYLTDSISASANYLPSQVTDTLLLGRAFATVHHNNPGRKNICALAMIKKTLRVLVASNDGFLYIYCLDTSIGGDCQLIRQFRLTDIPFDPTKQDQRSLERETQASASPTKDEPRQLVTPPTSPEAKPKTEDNEKFHELDDVPKTSPTSCFLLSDDDDYPPSLNPSTP